MESATITCTLNSAEKIFLVQNSTHMPQGKCYAFRDGPSVHYQSYCDDFGPFNMSSTIRFIEQLQDEIAAALESSCDQLIYSVPDSPRSLSNAVMLLGSYLILQEDLEPAQVVERFAGIDWTKMEDFRDPTHQPADFGLTLVDCWSGLRRGKGCGWVDRPSEADSPLWGEIDVEQYEHDDSPLNGDMTEVVPYKFIAFRGPKDLVGGALYQDDTVRGTRKFAPAYFAETLKDIGVSDVIRLNEPEYDAGAFRDAGLHHHDLFFEDCYAPPDHIVTAFFRIVDAAAGTVAVHCKAGLGRTGTLIAMYMMRSHGFTAREAMGWLRIMRPGSVIGEQQHYLCDVERSYSGTEHSRVHPTQFASIALSDVPSLMHAEATAESSAASWGLARAQSGPPGMPSAGTAAVAAELARVRAGEVSAALDAQGAARIGVGQARAARRAERP